MIDCQYCDEFKKGFLEFEGINHGNRILYESENFLVFPTLGQIIEGYLLIASKKHFIGIGNVPDKLYSELEFVQNKVKSVLSKNYEIPIFFEHGTASKNKKGGCCIEHAHIHAVPLKLDILNDLDEYYKYKKIESFYDLKERYNKKQPYIFYESNFGNRYLFEVPDLIPSQLIRAIIAEKINQEEKWNWKTYPGIEELLKTKEKLINEFDE